MEEAYKQTDYIVQGLLSEKEDFIISIGNFHPQLDNLKISSLTFITAWNPYSQLLSKEENIDRNSKLKNVIESFGYKSFMGIGIAKDKSWSEESFFVIDILEKEAKSLGKRFEQNAIVFGENGHKARLIFLA